MVNRFLQKLEYKPVLIKHNDVAYVSIDVVQGLYHYTIYSLLGRLVVWLRQTLKLLLLGVALLFIPGEVYFYLIFLVLYIPYGAYVTWRLRIVSSSISGQCPACFGAMTIELQPDERLTLWKYCPACKAPLRISEH